MLLHEGCGRMHHSMSGETQAIRGKVLKGSKY